MNELSPRDNLRFRAVAILAIAAHNFLHWVSEHPGENEYGFTPSKAESFLRLMREEPENFLTLMASYYGHYGVHIFVFLSGYGLSRKYLTGAGRMPSWWAFEKHRWASLYPAIGLSALGFFLYIGSLQGYHEVFVRHGWALLRQGLGLGTFFSQSPFTPVGPWWFISLILQLYLLYPALAWMWRRWGRRALWGAMGFSLTAEIFFSPIFRHWTGVEINMTALGHLDVFVLGMLLALRGSTRLPRRWAIASALVFVVGSLWGPLWNLANPAFVIAAVALGMKLRPRIERTPKLDRVLCHLGELSIYLFLVCGYLRRPLITYAQEAQNWWTSLWTCALFLSLCLVVAEALQGAEKGLRKVISTRFAPR